MIYENNYNWITVYRLKQKKEMLEAKLCTYLLQYLIYLLILNIHKVITPVLREI